MKTRITEQPEIQSYPIGIYCYFGFDLILESCEVSVCQTQSVNKRYPICPNLPCCEQHIALRRRFGGKYSETFAYFSKKHTKEFCKKTNKYNCTTKKTTTFAHAKGALTDRTSTKGEKGIRCKSETIPVAVSPYLSLLHSLPLVYTGKA